MPLLAKVSNHRDVTRRNCPQVEGHVFKSEHPARQASTRGLPAKPRTVSRVRLSTVEAKVAAYEHWNVWREAVGRFTFVGMNALKACRSRPQLAGFGIHGGFVDLSEDTPVSPPVEVTMFGAKALRTVSATRSRSGRLRNEKRYRRSAGSSAGMVARSRYTHAE